MWKAKYVKIWIISHAESGINAVFDVHLIQTFSFYCICGHHKSTELPRNTEGCKNKSENLGGSKYKLWTTIVLWPRQMMGKKNSSHLGHGENLKVNQLDFINELSKSWR